MTSENSDDGSAVVSDASSYKCDTVTPESVSSPKVVQSHADNAAKPSPRKSPRMSAAFGGYLNKAIAQGSRSFYGTDSEASDDDGGCDAELIGKAAHALSEDINDRIRLRVGPCSPTPSKGPCSPTASQSDPAADIAVIGDSATAMEAPVPDNVEPSPAATVAQGCNSQPDCEERAAQTTTSGDQPEVLKLEDSKRPDVVHTATQSGSETDLPSAESSPPVKPDESHRPSADPDLLKQRASQLEKRVRLLKERKSSSRKPSSNVPGGSFVEQLKKLDLSLDGGTLKVCDRNLSENALATVVNAVRNNDKLTELDLSGCCILKWDDLADLVRNAPSLQRLLLAWNCLGSARTGVAALASAVASATSLQEVDLRSNRIGPATAAALALALRTNNTLKRLDLMWNEIGGSGATAMLDSLLQKNRMRQAIPEDCTDGSVHPAVICRSSNCAEPASRGSQSSRDSRNQDNSRKIIQDELQMIRKNLADVEAELDDLHKQKAEVISQLEASREELCEETKRREQIERDFEEVRMELCKAQQETDCLQEKLHASACESDEKIAALETETIGRRESERATLERETEVSKQNQHLTDQLGMLREDSDKRIQAMEDRGTKVPVNS